jgi:hypothetical protein
VRIADAGRLNALTVIRSRDFTVVVKEGGELRGFNALTVIRSRDGVWVLFKYFLFDEFQCLDGHSVPGLALATHMNRDQ